MMTRLSLVVRGIVQGVGFRPFVHAAATQRGLSGWVRNGGGEVRLEVQGPEGAIRDFVEALRRAPPPPARVESIETFEVPPAPGERFEILPSAEGDEARPAAPPDQATCEDCRAEVQTAGARRHGYPFTNCARCGPRYSIIERLPYDRARTAMRRYKLCADCAAEYADARDRRFHAEPIACPACGPQLRLLTANGRERTRGAGALAEAAEALRAGRILAMKGLGGFQLLVDATAVEAVMRLRERKARGEKPFAVMFPSLQAVRAACDVSPEEAALLSSPEAPIVLLRRSGGARRLVVDSAAPRSPWLGAMLPYTPLHQLLLAEVGRPLICTSGNLAEEPMCLEEEEALLRLGRVADDFLVHDRPVLRPVDDSVARVEPHGVRVLRRARGYAPLPLRLRAAQTPCVLALGGQLKSTVTLVKDGQAVVSQHLGDLASPESAHLLERTAWELLRFLDAKPDVIACDLHPDYASTLLADQLSREWNVPVEPVQHHHAHVAACMAEAGLEGPVLGLAWDGAGLGPDGTLWGGEALRVDGAGFERLAYLRPFRLPGGERAMREPIRAALGLLQPLGGNALSLSSALPARDAAVLQTALERGINAPWTSSMGRLFDAVSALAGVRERAGFEGQAAMELEMAADGAEGEAPYPLRLGDGAPAVIDWEPLVRAVLADRAGAVPAKVISARFHEALAALAEALAVRAGLPDVVLSGGCFQNARLTRRVHERLSHRGFQVFTPRLYPPNDGGLSLGQAWVAALRWKEGTHVPGHPR